MTFLLVPAKLTSVLLVSTGRFSASRLKIWFNSTLWESISFSKFYLRFHFRQFLLPSGFTSGNSLQPTLIKNGWRLRTLGISYFVIAACECSVIFAERWKAQVRVGYYELPYYLGRNLFHVSSASLGESPFRLRSNERFISNRQSVFASLVALSVAVFL